MWLRYFPPVLAKLALPFVRHVDYSEMAFKLRFGGELKVLDVGRHYVTVHYEVSLPIQHVRKHEDLHVDHSEGLIRL